MKKYLVGLVLASLLGLASPPAPAAACSCSMPRSPADALDSSSAVFQGRVIAIEQPDQLEINYSVRLVVDTVWKGAALAEIVVMSRQYDAICGYPFVLGQNYLVYATEEREQLVVGRCSGTRPTSEAQVDLNALGPGTPGKE